MSTISLIYHPLEVDINSPALEYGLDLVLHFFKILDIINIHKRRPFKVYN